MATTVAIDIGGTFTDLVAIDSETGKVTTLKEPSQPADFAGGVTAALERAALGDFDQFRHGTTVGTNAIIERKGAVTGLLTTFGFRDVLHAARANKPDLYDSHWDPPAPLVPRPLIKGVRERVDFSGSVVHPLVEADVRAAAEELRAQGVEAIAICFLNSFMNGDHERRTKEIVEEVCPDAFVCTSSDVLPEIREFERTSTTVANAYLGPRMSRYLHRLESELRKGSNGSGKLLGEVLVSHSGGGLMTMSSASELPARICQSGPAAGVMGAHHVATKLGYPNAISLDMGGTSADIAAIIDGVPAQRNEWHIEHNIPILFPATDLVTIGAGGGTIAWVDSAGSLHSGPQSAGADPGPACYRRGGENPTNTDANVILGRLPADRFLGGRVSLDRDLAERAMYEKVAKPLGMSVDEAAQGVLRLSNTAMLNAIRLMTTQRGYDPREFMLIAFGGAGSLHAADLAREIGMSGVIVPRLPGLMSARGTLYIDVRHDMVEPLFQRGSAIDGERLAAAERKLRAEADDLRGRERSITDWSFGLSADLRYAGQISGYLTMPVESGGDLAAALGKLVDGFGDEHEREFGYRLPGEIGEVEIVNLRSSLVGAVDKPAEPAFAPVAPSGRRETGPVRFFGEPGPIDTPYVERDELGAGEVVHGPLVLTEWDSTILVPPRTSVRVGDHGDLILTFTR